MGLRIVFSGLRPLLSSKNGIKISLTGTKQHEKTTYMYKPPKLRLPRWFVKQDRVKYDEMLTKENQQFLGELVEEMRQSTSPFVKNPVSPLKQQPVLRGTWEPRIMRTGLIGIKLGITRQWLANGKPIHTTLIQILENQVIRYIPKEENVCLHKRALRIKNPRAALVIGAVDQDPQLVTKEYAGLFAKAGTMPKKKIAKFLIHPEAAIQPGTPLYAAHFRVGDFVDITGITIYRGFQGVMKKWGFHGMPASHGQTKTHRRPGCIGGGIKKRVWPGKKMPGVMGYKPRTAKGWKVVRIDHKNNVLYLHGTGIPGEVNSFVFLYDTLIPTKSLKECPRFPTYYPSDFENNPLPDEEFDPKLFDLSLPTITFEQEKTGKKK